MPRIISKARRLRLDYQAKLGRPVTLQEVADAMGIERSALNRIELGKTRAMDFDTLVKFCLFYEVGVGDVLEYDPNTRRANMQGVGQPVPA